MMALDSAFDHTRGPVLHWLTLGKLLLAPGRSRWRRCVSDELRAQWLEDCAIRLLCVLGLDRFGDWAAGDKVVAPAFLRPPHLLTHAHAFSHLLTPSCAFARLLHKVVAPVRESAAQALSVLLRPMAAAAAARVAAALLAMGAPPKVSEGRRAPEDGLQGVVADRRAATWEVHSCAP